MNGWVTYAYRHCCMIRMRLDRQGIELSNCVHNTWCRGCVSGRVVCLNIRLDFAYGYLVSCVEWPMILAILWCVPQAAFIVALRSYSVLALVLPLNIGTMQNCSQALNKYGAKCRGISECLLVMFCRLIYIQYSPGGSGWHSYHWPDGGGLVPPS